MTTEPLPLTPSPSGPGGPRNRWADADDELARLRAELAYLHTHDPLTGLLNRDELEHRLQELEATGVAESALLLIDLDGFHRINQAWGHRVGDRALVQAAVVLRGTGPDGTALARLRADPFVALLVGASLAEARAVADRVHLELGASRFVWGERRLPLRASIGVVSTSGATGGDGETGGDGDPLVAAHRACQAAKLSGGDLTRGLDPDDTAILLHRGEVGWTFQIEEALAERRLRLDLQPIRRLAGDHGERPIGELLVRLLDRRGEIVQAERFIRAAERFNLIRAIDDWVVATALEALGSRPDAGVFSVNLSARSLADPAFLESIVTRLDASGVDPTRLWLEITETAAIRHLTRANRCIARLKDRGCRFGLDDFGSGFNSLNSLRALAVDYVKIDGELVRGLRGDATCLAIVEAVQRISAVSGLATVAECVEDAETLEAARRIGVDYVQGHHVGVPMPLG
jgi:diguanylate cyclase (GGDEF)-like protein